VFRRIFDSERKTVFKGMGFLAHRTVEYREEKVQTCTKIPHYIQHQAQFGLLVWLLFLRALYSYEKSEARENS
jgi:capsule polysaccharide modification protein KpsS